MKDFWRNDKEFKEAIGSFVIAFSELEFGLVYLCSMTEFDPRKKNEFITKYLGYNFDRKIQHLSEFISEYLEELMPIWEKHKIEIGQLNRERRFLVHGFMSFYLPNESITTRVKENGMVATKDLTLAEIKSFTNRLQTLNTGENGINGEFHTLFTKTRINKWNDLVNDDNKVVYSVNSEIISSWKGK